MPYIWEKYSLDKTFSIGIYICPCMEVFEDDSISVDVNPLIRFNSLYEELQNVKKLGCIDEKELENILFHFLAQIDRCDGLDKRQAQMESLRQEIEAGYYGQECQFRWQKLSRRDQECILYVLAEKQVLQNRDCFMWAIRLSFPFASLCFEKATGQYYLYLGVQYSEYYDNLACVIRFLFWRLDLLLDIIWDKHYGIIGSDNTMEIDSIQIIGGIDN